MRKLNLKVDFFSKLTYVSLSQSVVEIRSLNRQLSIFHVCTDSSQTTGTLPQGCVIPGLESDLWSVYVWGGLIPQCSDYPGRSLQLVWGQCKTSDTHHRDLSLVDLEYTDSESTIKNTLKFCLCALLHIPLYLN